VELPTSSPLLIVCFDSSLGAYVALLFKMMLLLLLLRAGDLLLLLLLCP
jgi:hypothetical protein